MNLHIDTPIKKILNSLSEKLSQNNSLDELIRLYLSYGLNIKIGAEIEFYNPENQKIQNYHVTTERGNNQYEINIDPTSPKDAALQIRNCINILEKKSGILLSPKPLKYDYGNSIQINISIWDKKENNIFNNQDILEKSCDILCSYMLDSFLIFAPIAECYDRFESSFMAPVNVSKGHNNRTTAIRIPSIGAKRIEYRLGAYPADPNLMIYILLKQLAEYLIYKKESKEYEIIFGRASNRQYALEALPKNLEEAERLFTKSLF